MRTRPLWLAVALLIPGCIEVHPGSESEAALATSSPRAPPLTCAQRLALPHNQLGATFIGALSHPGPGLLAAFAQGAGDPLAGPVAGPAAADGGERAFTARTAGNATVTLRETANGTFLGLEPALQGARPLPTEDQAKARLRAVLRALDIPETGDGFEVGASTHADQPRYVEATAQQMAHDRSMPAAANWREMADPPKMEGFGPLPGLSISVGPLMDLRGASFLTFDEARASGEADVSCGLAQGPHPEYASTVYTDLLASAFEHDRLVGDSFGYAMALGAGPNCYGAKDAYRADVVVDAQTGALLESTVLWDAC